MIGCMLTCMYDQVRARLYIKGRNVAHYWHIPFDFNKHSQLHVYIPFKHWWVEKCIPILLILQWLLTFTVMGKILPPSLVCISSCTGLFPCPSGLHWHGLLCSIVDWGHHWPSSLVASALKARSSTAGQGIGHLYISLTLMSLFISFISPDQFTKDVLTSSFALLSSILHAGNWLLFHLNLRVFTFWKICCLFICFVGWGHTWSFWEWSRWLQG